MNTGRSTTHIAAVAEPNDKTIRNLKIALLVTLVVTFGILIYGTVATYRYAPALPGRFVTPRNNTLFTGKEVTQGKAAFQEADLMDYGSLYGMGSYFGADYTASFLHNLGRATEEALAQSRYHMPLQELGAGQRYVIRQAMRHDLQQIPLQKAVVSLPQDVVTAVRSVRAQAVTELLHNSFAHGWTKPGGFTTEKATHLADFLLYSAFTTIARRPGQSFSYTNNWPYAPTEGNVPTPATFVWTWVSIAWVFFATGAVIYLFYRYIHENDTSPKETLIEGFPPLTESQRKTGKYFLTVAALFLLQIVAGTLMAHDYADRASFYGLALNNILPFAFLRSAHIQLPILWIGLAWIGAGLFIGPLIGGKEPKGQGRLVDILYIATVVVAVGGLAGDYAGIQGWFSHGSWFWWGNQGLSYLELGRAYQMGLFAGLSIWSILVGRAMWPALKARKGFMSVEHILFYTTINIAVIYAFGMIPVTSIASSFTITDFWRWWVVHLWVEQAFELFVVAVTGYFLMALGLVSRRTTLVAVLFETMLVFLGGDNGIGHHMYWVGEPGMWLSVGSLFSYIEVLPLILLVIEALIEHRDLVHAQKAFPHKLAYKYIIGSAFWNFLGAGVFGGGLINAPLVNYYEHGTFLTLAHAHTALFGAFGLIAIGLIYFVLRYAAGESEWNEGLGNMAFWCFNIGMALWLTLNFWPIGFQQLTAIYTHGYAYGRSLAFYNTTTVWQWLRMPGDIVFSAGALLVAVDFVIKVRALWKPGAIAPAGPAVLANAARKPL
ncbi:MAG TPA: cbb3-type cytochrome c oxidase subunit I [Acidiferrobacter sp.]|nr:cbb3-type cytochrome c oxidase subunit I [Acidiferrobacter sp.]